MHWTLRLSSTRSKPPLLFVRYISRWSFFRVETPDWGRKTGCREIEREPFAFFCFGSWLRRPWFLDSSFWLEGAMLASDRAYCEQPRKVVPGDQDQREQWQLQFKAVRVGDGRKSHSQGWGWGKFYGVRRENGDGGRESFTKTSLLYWKRE